MQNFRRLTVAIVICLAANIASAQDQHRPATVNDTDDLNYKQFALLVVRDGGRQKPVDTFARETLIRITSRSIYIDAKRRVWWPKDFLLSAVFKTHDWSNEPMVLVSSRILRERIGLPHGPSRFSFAQLTALPELNRLADEARAWQRAEKPLDRVREQAAIVSERLQLLGRVMDGSALLIVPPKNENDPWLVPRDFGRYYTGEEFSPVRTELEATAAAYVKADPFRFSRASKRLRDSLRALSPTVYPDYGQMRLEYFYNHLEAFFRVIWLYGAAFVLLLIAHLRGRGTALRNIGVGVALVGLGLHAVGIMFRCMIGDRSPATNMYESIIWVSFAVALFGMIFIARYRTSICLHAALPVTLVALLLVHQMPIAMPASIDPLVPALRDNFWLTTHVLTITLGYAAFALAMGLGHVLVWRYARNPGVTLSNPPMRFGLDRALQLGVVLLFAGTVMGVWTNYSQSGNWGWTLKETWAVAALVCYTAALRGRFSARPSQFGLGVGSIVCFFAVLMSWFNLGQGLYSDESGIGVEMYVVPLMVFDLLFVGIAAWRYQGGKPALPHPAAEVAGERVAV